MTNCSYKDNCRNYDESCDLFASSCSIRKRWLDSTLRIESDAHELEAISLNDIHLAEVIKRNKNIFNNVGMGG